MGRRIKIITEYRQTGGDADGDNMVAMGCGWVQNILPCHPLIGGVSSDFYPRRHADTLDTPLTIGAIIWASGLSLAIGKNIPQGVDAVCALACYTALSTSATELLLQLNPDSETIFRHQTFRRLDLC